jgi:hypothetical protein
MLEDVTSYIRKSNEENGRYAFGAPDYVPRGYIYERLPISGVEMSHRDMVLDLVTFRILVSRDVLARFQ